MLKNKLIPSLIIISSFLLSLSASEDSHPMTQTSFSSNQIVSIKEHLKICKENVSLLSKNNVNVLAQYDLFADHLEKVYLAGEGLIDLDINRIIDAIAFSAERHQYQTRKDPQQTPYIIHPIGVADHLFSIGKIRDPDIIIAALLHDTVEDTETSFEDIQTKFGSRVEGFVREVTDDKSLPKQTRKQLQIEHAPHKSAGAAQIKLADKLYNLRDLLNHPPEDWESERVEAYFQWAQKVVDNLPWVNAPLKKAVDEAIEQHRK